MSDNEKIFIQNLINLRKVNKLLQKEMAAILGVKESTYRAWEQFRNFPEDILYPILIASFFQYKVEEMYRELIPVTIAA